MGLCESYFHSTNPTACCLPSTISRIQTRPVFTNPLTGQRWYSDTPLVDQSQAPRFLASSPFPTSTYRSSQNTQFTSQHPSLPLSTHVPGTPQRFIPAHPITLPHPPMINTYPTSSPQVAQPPAYNQLAPRFAPAAPPATHTELEDAPLIFSPLQGWMTMNCRILIDEQMGETGW
ncbi:hypothetical protein DL95DRAFT_191972 [Leptodontidium sp. 2 PMI_412]|nr:hypothetical protein DL95DRAFT_191972 [Leptodontidium sp. 2 PMI_412]